MNKLEVALPKETAPVVDITSEILILAIIVLISVYNVLMFVVANLLIDKYDLEKKISSSWIKKKIERYRKLSLIYVFVEFLIIFVFLSVIIIGCTMSLGINIYNLF